MLRASGDEGRRTAQPLPSRWGIWYSAAALVAILAASVPVRAQASHPAGTPPPRIVPQPSGRSGLNTVLIEASRIKRQVHRRASRFLSSVTVTYLHDSLPRWNEPMCPLVAGLPRADGEYILARVTQIASAAGAPIAGEHCRPNLYIVATPHPHLLLEKWWTRDPLMYNECNGLGGIERFLHSKRPVRVWYNVVPQDANGQRRPAASLDAPSVGVNLGPTQGCITSGDGRQGLSQVIVVIDLSQVASLKIGPLAAYVSMLGLAQIRLTSLPAAPSILALFAPHAPPVAGLTRWDRALLHALYHTPQDIGWDGLLEVSRIRNSMTAQLLATPPARR